MKLLCKKCGKVIPCLTDNVENIVYQLCEDCSKRLDYILDSALDALGNDDDKIEEG